MLILLDKFCFLSQISSISLFGFLFGAIGMGILGDAKGRKKTLCIADFGFFYQKYTVQIDRLAVAGCYAVYSHIDQWSS